MKKLLFLLNMMFALPVAVFAAGLDLTWNECVGMGTEANDKTFVCTGTVNQSYNLVIQFKSPVTLSAAAEVYAIIDLEIEQGVHLPLSPFWRYEPDGCQRPSAGINGVALFDDIRLLPGCAGQDADLWDGDGSAGFEGMAYEPDFPTPGRGRFILFDARGSGIPLAAGANYYAFHLVFNNRHRVDCAGCGQKVAMFLDKMTISSTDGTPALEVVGPDKKFNCATIQGAFCFTPDPTRIDTWGRIKAAYR